jgi:hypothetical protein
MPDGRLVDSGGLFLVIAYPLLMWVLAPLAMRLVAARARRRYDAIWQEVTDAGVSAAGTVTNRLRIGPKGRPHAWALEVAFLLGPDDWMRANVVVPEGTYQALSLGDAVGVRHHPTQPAYARLDDGEALVPQADRCQVRRGAPGPLACALFVAACLPFVWVGLSERGWPVGVAPGWASAVAATDSHAPLLLALLLLFIPSRGSPRRELSRIRTARRGLPAVATIIERRQDAWGFAVLARTGYHYATARWTDREGRPREAEAPVAVGFGSLVVGQDRAIRYLPTCRAASAVPWVPEGEPIAALDDVTGLVDAVLALGFLVVLMVQVVVPLLRP